MNRYEISTPRAACRFAAIAMTIITIGVMVVLSAKIVPANREARAHPESRKHPLEPAEGANRAAGPGTADDRAGVTRASVNPRALSALGYGYDGLSAVAPTKRSRPAALAR